MSKEWVVVISGNTGSAPLIGSQVIGDRAANRSVWSEKGLWIQDPIQIRCKLRLARG